MRGSGEGTKSGCMYEKGGNLKTRKEGISCVTNQERSTGPGEGGSSIEISRGLQHIQLLLPGALHLTLEWNLPRIQLDDLEISILHQLTVGTCASGSCKCICTSKLVIKEEKKKTQAVQYTKQHI